MSRPPVRHLRVSLFLLAVVSFLLVLASPGGATVPAPSFAGKRMASLRRSAPTTAGVVPADSGQEERGEIAEQAAQFAEPRIGPPGALAAAWSDAATIPMTGGSWREITNRPYQNDDPRFADPVNSNSGAGWGFAAGRMSALAVDGRYLYAGGADGGVWRSTDGGDHWVALTDDLPTTSVGSLAIDPADHSVWLGTGESNSSGDEFLGLGVFRSADHGATWHAVATRQLDASMVARLTFDGRGHVFAATSQGVYRRSADAPLGRRWTLVLRPGKPSTFGFTFANDVEVQPGTQGSVVIANVAATFEHTTYNGFYRSTDDGVTWKRVHPTGLDAANIGRTSFAYDPSGARLFAVVQSIDKTLSNPETGLMGAYLSRSGSVAGPWTMVASARSLSRSPRSALPLGFGYAPGVQVEYNQFIGVDPTRPNDIYLGLEEVYRSTDGGRTWRTIGPYWNFDLPCYANGGPTACQPTTHPDQHAIAFGRGQVWIGDDGGVYSRRSGGFQWFNHNVGLNTLQYYTSGVGSLPGGNLGYWGGLQDNGTSFLRTNNPIMAESAGGDGGATIVDPNDANRSVQEYPGGDFSLTTNGGRSRGSRLAWREVSPSCEAFTYTPDPCDDRMRFVAPLASDVHAPNDRWVTGGRYVWETTKGYDTHCSADACDWKIVRDLGAESSMAGVAVSGHTIYAGFCGGDCNPAEDFYAGIDTNYGGVWHRVAGPHLHNGGDQLPHRVPANLVVDPGDAAHVYAIYTGYDAEWIPSAGVGHVFETWDGGATWTDISGNLPDAPAEDLVPTNGKLVLATDVGMFITSAAAPGHWLRFGHGLPNAVALDLTTTPDGAIVAATHGRGLWEIPAP
jgi:hypothetical protein